MSTPANLIAAQIAADADRFEAELEVKELEARRQAASCLLLLALGLVLAALLYGVVYILLKLAL